MGKRNDELVATITKEIGSGTSVIRDFEPEVDMEAYGDPEKLKEEYRQMVLDEIERMEKAK